MPAPVEVETPRMRVDLDHNVMLGAGPQHLVDIDFVAWTALELTAGNRA